jgi:proprotein convertase subtilisin/kexin type 5
VKSTLGTVALPSTVQSRCYSYVCNSDNIVFTVGTNTITCLSSEEGIQKTLSAFTGYLQCPNFNAFCTYSRKTCPNWCSQNGYCMGGICNCISGYYGDDCSKTICTSGLFYNTLTLTCVATCPSGYYANTYNTACMKCHSSCQQCYGEPTICTGCVSSASNPQYYYNSTCSSQCPAGTYATGFTCTICDSAVSFCKTCDVIATNCTSCITGKFLSQPGYGTCIPSCPTTGTYSVTDMVNSVCVATCSSNLVLINTGINTCQFCPNSTYKLTSNSSCVTSCPNFFYANDTIWLCSRCDASCLTCNGGYAENCTSCSPTATLKYLLLKMCWSVCPGGYYANDTAGACQICPTGQNCGNCTYQNSSQAIICTSCAYGYFFQSNTSTCLSGCDPNQFPNLGNNSCVTCDTSCLTCIGPGTSSCASCLSPLLFVGNVTGGFCISECPGVGYYSGLPTLNKCIACDLTCLNCSGSSASQCTACFNGSYLNLGYCRYVCPPAKYPNDILRVCSICDGSCTFCFGSTIN